LKFTLPPEMWLHGIQSRFCRMSFGSASGSGWSMAMAQAICAVIWPWVCGVGLGMPVEPEVNRYLPTESGPSQSIAVSTTEVGSVSASVAKASEPSEPSAEMMETPSSGRIARALRNGSIVWTKIALGFTAPKQCLSLAKSEESVEYAIEIG